MLGTVLRRSSSRPPLRCTPSPGRIPTSVVFGAPPGIDGTLYVGAEHGDVVIHAELAGRPGAQPPSAVGKRYPRGDQGVALLKPLPRERLDALLAHPSALEND
jgi:hypothetical protein